MPSFPLKRGVAAAVLPLLLLTAAPVRAGRAGEVRVRSFDLLNEGVSAYNKGEYARAIDALRESASMALNSFRANYYLGLALSASRRYRESIEALTIALDLDPTHLQSLVAMGDAHLKLGDLEEARAAYFRGLKLRPAYAAALDGVARTYESQAQYDTAIDHFHEAILSNKGYAPAYTHLGDLFLRLNRVEEAVRLLEEAISVRPDYAPGMNRLALAYGRLGLENEAAATIQAAIDLEPHNPAHLITLGRLQLDRGLISNAEGTFYDAMKLEPGMPEARFGLAAVARGRGEYELALEEVDMALEDERSVGRLRTALIDFREMVESESVLVADIEGRMAQGQTEVDGRDMTVLAVIYARRGLWQEAAELLESAPPSVERSAHLAYLRFRSGSFRQALELYSELAATLPEQEHKVNHGVALARLGRDAEAIDVFHGILDQHPESLRAQLYLANALLRSGRAEDAAVEYRHFLDLHDVGEDAERVRRILKQIAPDLLPGSGPSLIPALPDADPPFAPPQETPS